MGQISRAEIEGWLDYEPVYYSLWMPGGPDSAVIVSNDPTLFIAYHLTIEDDDIFVACVKALIEDGVPVFDDVAKQNVFCKAFEDGLRAALTPEDAREAALQAVGMGGSGKVR